jgi:hypothetical protein
MDDDAGTSGDDDLEGLFQAVQDRAESLGGDQAELAREWRTQVADQQRAAEESWAKIIQAVRELLARSAMPRRARATGTPPASARTRPGQARTTPESGHQRTAGVLSDLTDSPNGLTQLQSLLMLAAVIRAFSQESGHPEAEILAELAADQGR